jgi:NitT/TauT family transport system substrate-binding protein
VYLALERAYFQQQGLAIELMDFGSGIEAIQHLATGELEVSVAGLNAALFNALSRRVPIKMVAPGDTYYPEASTVFLLVRSDLVDRGEIQDYADLMGRRIAVPARSAFLHYVAALAVARGGLRLSDVALVELGLPEMNVALARAAVDVAVQLEPMATQATARGIATKWRGAGEIRPGLQGGGIFFAPDFLSERAEIGRRWMVAYLQGVRDYQQAVQWPGGRQEIAAILARHTPVTDLGLYDRMAFPYLDPNLHLDEASFSEQHDWYVEQGLVPAPIAIEQALDPRFAEFAVQQLGRSD